MKSSARVAFLFLAFLGSRAATNAESYSFTHIDLPSAVIQPLVEGINDYGQIVGSFLDGVHPRQGFLYDHGTFTIIDFPGASITDINAINNSGQMVGTSSLGGFLYSGGQFILINVPGSGIATTPMDINDSGAIVGNYETNTGPHGFLYSNGTFTTIDSPHLLDGINDSGQIVGHDGVLNPNGVLTPLNIPGGANALKFGFNNAGLVVGSSGGSPSRGFLYENGTFTTIDVPGAIPPYGVYSVPDINNLNEIVANVFLAPGGLDPFLGTPTAIPEPRAILLMALGITGIGLCLRVRAYRSRAPHIRNAFSQIS